MNAKKADERKCLLNNFKEVNKKEITAVAVNKNYFRMILKLKRKKVTEQKIDSEQL